MFIPDLNNPFLFSLPILIAIFSFRLQIFCRQVFCKRYVCMYYNTLYNNNNEYLFSVVNYLAKLAYPKRRYYLHSGKENGQGK